MPFMSFMPCMPYAFLLYSSYAIQFSLLFKKLFEDVIGEATVSRLVGGEEVSKGHVDKIMIPQSK